MIDIKECPGNNRVIEILLKAKANTKSEIRHGLREVGLILTQDLRKDMLKSKSGIKYKRLRRRSSASGESPRSQSGKLRKSVDFNVKGYDELNFGYDNSVDYGRYLELGTKKMSARPGLRNSINNNEKTCFTRFNNRIDKIFPKV